MSSVSFCVALALSVLGLSDARGFHSQALQLPGRSLQQNELATVTRLRVVNFATLAAANDEVVTENELSGKVNVTASDEPVMYGAYYLGPSQVEQMDRIISTELEAVPASEATLAPVIGFPGRQLKGRSVLDSLNDMQPRRIPTIFAPFYSGFKFELVGRESPPGTTLHFSNMTLMVANATYEDLATSGIMDYFDLQTSARVCMTNSMFVLESCKGFVPNSFHMWCCTKRQCNIQYTEQAIEDLGYPMPDALELLTCHELLPSGGQEEAKSAGGSGGSDLVVPLVASCLAVAAVLGVALIVVWRHRRTQRANRMKADEMQMQIGKYMQQLEKHREKSRNEQAELQKVKMQYKMLEMDLLANTASGKTASAKGLPSEDKAATETTQEDRTAPPQTLTVLDAGDSEVSAKAVQKQLRAVLNAADERTPVSVQAEIGRGAFGVVYRGVWKNIQVAIKTVLFQASGDIKNDPVLREAMLALRIAHPNLVATYRANVRTLEDTAAPGGGGQQQFQITGDITPSYQLFLLQEFCDSGTLYDWLSRERMHPGNTPDQAVIVRCALDIARGIQHLHHSDIVHGDLKPQNIMLTTIPEVVRAQSDTPSPPTFPYIAKLTDFGLSFQMDRNKSHMSNMRIGTPFYFAPEVQGKGYLSKAADTYSLGVLLWEMFHGMPPYAAENGHLVNNTSFPRFDLRHREDAPFSYVVVALACLSEDFEKRPSIDDVVVVLEDLNECLNGTPDGTQLMRNASLNRVTKGSYKAGFAAPASLVKQANAANATPAPRAGPQQRKRSPADGNVASAQVILKMLKHSGLHRDADLRKRLDVTDASELEKLAGVVSARTSGRAPQRCLRDVRGQNGAANVHGGQRWMFDVLPPSSVDGGQTPAPAMPQQQQQVPQQPPHQQPPQQPPRQ